MSAYTKPSCAHVPRRQRTWRSASGLSPRTLKQCNIHSENGLRARARERSTRRAAHSTRMHARVGPGLVKRARRHFNKGDGDGGGDDVVHGERAERQRHRVRDVEAREAADATPPARARGSARRLPGLRAGWGAHVAPQRPPLEVQVHALRQRRHDTRLCRPRRQTTHAGAARRGVRTSLVARLGRDARHTGATTPGQRLRLRAAAPAAARRIRCLRGAGRSMQRS